ncbi:UDP-2,3-diacetamido-2,3-dideoxy-D-glucuronate 2-epimerase [bacterium HR41]|nr:UDP-N-acetylglucosamine 2-epimerase (non-hydrolyzing) [Thermoleophilum sp.]GBD46244.1 UDP-2,3-diacetamido-2,3-dideoxy-D-glucuronate 2-epimerase [bacterium HR41]
MSSATRRPLVVTIVGNRPQFVKAAAVSRRLREHLDEFLVHTGQHYDRELSDVFFEELDLPTPDLRLEAGGGSNLEQLARMLPPLEALLRERRPALALVYGDTNTTLAGALAARAAGVPTAHVEAGMRSFDRAMPEETNRVLTDHVSDLLLCPTETAVANLAREGIEHGVHLVGDVMADVLLAGAEIAERRSRALEERQLEPGGYLLVTAHRAGNVDDHQRLLRLVELIEALPLTTLLPLHPRTRQRLLESDLFERLERAPHVRIEKPLGYLDFVRLLRNARAVLTDSGGVQKEAYLLATPCITLRDRTEWVETVESGWNVLVDLDRDRALAALARTPPPQRPELFGGGRAGERVCQVVCTYTGAQ